ncbi:MAG: AMP-binding protein [Pyrinomonadaceae bacterium]
MKCARAQLTAFMKCYGVHSFAETYQRSIEDVASFTESLLDFLDIKFSPPYTNILDTSRGIEWSRWCVGGGLNIAARCVDYWLDKPTANQFAIIWEGEEGTTRTLTYSEVAREVERCAAGLRACGFKKGDAVGIHLPMIPETVVALLALARIGAIAVPVFSGYGATAIETRLRDVEAKALITCDAFPRRGKATHAKQTADEAVARCSSVEKVFVVARMNLENISRDDKREMLWSKLLELGAQEISKDENASRIEATDAEDTLLIIYTSGTTGRPKGIVHTHCGFPIKAAQDMCFGTDVGTETRISWLTDIGWMMGPWLIYGALILGGTIVLYDGAPDYPAPDRMWQFVAKHKVEALGISPTLIRALAAHGDELPARHDLSSLRLFASTGEPWNPDPWLWLFEKVGNSRIPIINYSGGTEISGGILMGNPLLPAKPCSFASPCPGIAADILDENGKSVQANTVGELVIRKPWIGMARGFWKDPERYLETYWQRFLGVWVHGDWASFDEDGHWYIHGRSDDTLKIAGKRVGPAEVESILVSHDAVIEAAAIGVPDEKKGTALIAFCVLTSDAKGDAKLAETLRELIGAELGKPLRPEKVLFVKSLPKTRNAKVMRRVIRAAYLGEDAGDVSALENPQAVEEIRRTARQ